MAPTTKPVFNSHADCNVSNFKVEYDLETPYATRGKIVQGTDVRPPVAKPLPKTLPFTLTDIKSAIPPHLFEASIPTSVYYIARDICQWALAVAVTSYLLNHVVSEDRLVLRTCIWLLYGFAQGTTGFGMWVIGHECGHQAYFGNRPLLNDTVGFIIHSFMLAPYHSWRITHGIHHRFTGLKSKDTAFVPKHIPGAMFAVGEVCPALHWLLILGYFVLGWPLYIFTYWEGQKYDHLKGLRLSHFNPYAPYFTPNQRHLVVLSGVGFFGMIGLLVYASLTFGWLPVFQWYGLGYLFNYTWLVIITFLQHSDQRLPHYDDDEEWDFVKGALATVDRDYGSLLNNMMHHITDDHVVHHLFSRMAFYNAHEATPYVAKRVGNYYLKDTRPILQQFWESWFVHQSSFFRSRKWQAKNPPPSQG